MTHGRKPRKPRVLNANAFNTALYRASCLTEAEIRDTIDPARQCLDRLREGVATEDQHIVLSTCMHIAMDIERSGIVRGLEGHIKAAQQALGTIRSRALATGAWRASALYFYELDALREAVDLHEFQLRKLSAGELHSITQRLIARTLSSGGVSVHTHAAGVGLQAA
ncbi:MAG: hypothetical protein EOO32_00045 [Comamonadaceae bacterium]|nr:MAG: hypothetical protein EOO32_00045 [Comamonadaceae bacterium]